MHAVTCRTEGCLNNGYTLILTNPGHTIICGPCGQVITDIDPPLPEEPYHPEELAPEPVVE